MAANSLTLMGRLTNPLDQRLWSLFPFLANRWTLKGKAVGSDLGRGCFQFCFDYEEDLQKVLDNRPYHFDQWMIILQKWEPIISDSFPSKIPFWIELQGLPKHYWQPEMLKSIGEELGEILDMEITSSLVKIRILIDGLQPLVKETVVDFPDGSEAIVLLEYKNLKNHCHHCFCLSHEKKNCPGLREATELPGDDNSSRSQQHPRESSRNYYTPKDNFTAPRNQQGGPVKSDIPQTRNSSLKRKFSDRERMPNSYSAERSYNRNHHSSRAPQGRSADLYGRRPSRELSYSQHSNDINRSSHQSNFQWKEKSSPIPISPLEISNSSRTRRPPLERNISSMAPCSPPLRRLHSLEVVSHPLPIPTKEQVMGELREVTVQYTTCADPTESAARKQRVLQGEAKNLMNNTADQIIEAVVASLPSSLPLLPDNRSGDPMPDTVPIEELLIPSKEAEKVVKRGRGRPPLSNPAGKNTLKITGVKCQ